MGGVTGLSPVTVADIHEAVRTLREHAITSEHIMVHPDGHLSPWISPGVSAKPSYCASSCHYCNEGVGFVPDEYNDGARIAFFLEAAGKDEAVECRPLVGKAGKYWEREVLRRLGISREECFVGNLLRCHPPSNEYPQGTLADRAEQACRYYDAYHRDPATGKPVEGGIKKFAPTVYLFTYHPAAALRAPGLKRIIASDLDRVHPLLDRDERPCVVMGDKPFRYLFPELPGGLRVWHGHYIFHKGWVG